MSTGLRSGGTRLLSLLLSFLIAQGSPAHAQVRRESFVPMEAVGPAADRWHLTQSYDRGTVNVAFDAYAGAIEDGRLVLRQGDAWHRFDAIDAVDFLIEPMFIAITARDGTIHVIQRKLLDGVIFRAPAPVHDITKLELDGDVSNYRLVIADEQDLLKMREVRVAAERDGLEVDPDRAFEAGDLLVLKYSGATAGVERAIPRGLILEELEVYSALIHYWMNQLHPRGEPKKLAERNAQIPWTAARLIHQLDRDTLEKLTGRAEFWRAQAARPRDVFKLGPEPDLNLADQLHPERPIKPATMLMIAAAATGTVAAAVTAFEYGCPPAVVELVNATLKNWLGYVSPVLVEPGYRWIMFKSALWMSTIPPIIMLATYALDRTVTHLNDTPSTFLQNGSRVIAEIAEPFWRRIAQVIRQPYVYRAIAVRQRPWRLVQPHSALGKRAGIDRATRLGWVSAQSTRENVDKLLTAREKMSDARYTLAHHLALTIIGEEQDLDVVTVEALLRSESPAARRALLVAPDANTRKYLLAGRLLRELQSRDEAYDADALSLEEYQAELNGARAIMDDIRRERGWDDFKRRARYEMNSALDKLARVPEEFARRQVNYWRTVRPKKSLGWEAVRNFFLDYYPGGALVYLSGSRANLADPSNLVAQAGVPLNTARQPLYGYVDTGRWWMWNQAAIYTEVYQGKDEHLDTTYDPRELENFKPRFRQPGAFRSLKWWLQDAVNPSSGKYGELILNRLRLSGHMMQASYLLTTVMRWAVAGVSLSAASANFLWHLTAGHLAIGLAWDVVTPTNERMSDRIEGYVGLTKNALGQIHRGLRMDEHPEWIKGMSDALALYDHKEARADREVRGKVAAIKQAFEREPTPADARDLLILLHNHPPLPGKNPTWLKGLASSSAVYISTIFGTFWDVYTFRPDLNWPIFLGLSIAAATAAYTGIGVATHAWRRHQRLQREREENCAFLLSEPALARQVGY